MSYNITKYTIDKANKLGVIVKPSNNNSKKLDVYSKDNKFICSVGAIGYKDYPTYMLQNGKAYADERRRLYRIRHHKDMNVKGTPGFYANLLLW
jgi:hypothetical protein